MSDKQPSLFGPRKESRDVLERMVDELTVDDIKGSDDLLYLYWLGGMDAVKKHLLGTTTVVELKLPPLKHMDKFLIRELGKNMADIRPKYMCQRLGWSEKTMLNKMSEIRAFLAEQRRKENGK